MKSYL
jgi:hypothetical protein